MGTHVEENGATLIEHSAVHPKQAIYNTAVKALLNASTNTDPTASNFSIIVFGSK